MLSSAPKKSSRVIVYTKALLIAASLSYLCLYTPKLFELENFSRDFSIHYNAATIVKRGLSEKLYDLETQRQYFPQQADLFLPYNHPPFAFIPYYPLSYLPFRAAFFSWTGVSVLLLFLCSGLMRSTYRLDLPKTPIEWPQLNILLCFFAFFPTWYCLLNGQNSILFLTLICSATYCFYRGKYAFTGFLLALTLIKPQLGIPISISFLFRSNRNCLFGYLAGVLLCTLGPILLLGNHGFSHLLRLFGELNDHQSAYGVHYAQMANLMGVFSRHPLGVGDNIRMVVSVILWILSVGWIGFSSYRFRQKGGAGVSCNQIFFDCRLVIISTLVSIHMNGHDFILLIAPILIILANAKYRFEIRTGSRTHSSMLILTALFSVALLTPLCWAAYIFLPDVLVAVQILLLIGSIRLSSDLQSSSGDGSGFQVPA